MIQHQFKEDNLPHDFTDLISCLALVCMNLMKSSYRVSVFVRKRISSSITEVPCYYLNSAAPQSGLTEISIWFGLCHEIGNNSEVTTIPAILERAKQSLWSSFWLLHHILLHKISWLECKTSYYASLIWLGLHKPMAPPSCKHLWFFFFISKKPLCNSALSFNSASTELSG